MQDKIVMSFGDFKNIADVQKKYKISKIRSKKNLRKPVECGLDDYLPKYKEENFISPREIQLAGNFLEDFEFCK